MQQEVVLALLAKEPSYGYELRARLGQDLAEFHLKLVAAAAAGLATRSPSWTPSVARSTANRKDS